MIPWKTLFQLAVYFIVGLGATIVEWGVFYVLNILWNFHYAIATAAAFALSTFANWILGRCLLFKKGSGKGLLHEIGSIYAVSIIGLLLNLLIMWILIDGLLFHDMIAKIIATAIVFSGNFIVRKYLIYKENK